MTSKHCVSSKYTPTPLPLYPRSYTAFIPLYPVGVLAEMKSVFDALPLIRARGLRTITMPNAWNFGFDYHNFLAVSWALCLVTSLPLLLPVVVATACSS